LKESFGWEKFSFDVQGNLKRWIFTDSLLIPVIAERFPEVEIDPEVNAIVRNEQQWINDLKAKEKKIEAIRTKTDTDFNVKGLKKDLYPYQKVGVEFLLESGGRAIVADSPGLGKTAEALAYIKHSGFKRCLVVCPASVKFAWGIEIKKWTQLSYTIIDSKTDLASIDPSINIWVVNYDILRKHLAQLCKIRFECLIGDECQLIKTPSAIRTRAFRQISRDISSIILLSGTPLLSRPAELFSLLNIIDARVWNNWYEYARRYCNLHQTRWGVDTSGASNVSELHARIKSYFIRRDKTEVLKELPPKNFINVPVELDDETNKKYASAASDLATYLRTYSGKQPPEIAKSLAAEKLTQLNVLRHLNSLGKIGTATELVESIIDAGEKVLVFCSFVQPLELLKEYFGSKAVILTGKTPVDEREEIVKKFQTDPKTQIFLGGIKSAGMGITLTAASNVVFLDYSWNPADMQQAQDRVHRPGQEASSVNIYQLSAMGTIDEDLKEILDRKQDIFDQVIDGKAGPKLASEAMESAVQRVLENY
jgi:SWI/SNF-related matrix-associated actin-dependent regulator 1 of chromatin subfamily A